MSDRIKVRVSKDVYVTYVGTDRAFGLKDMQFGKLGERAEQFGLSDEEVEFVGSEFERLKGA